MAGMHALNRKSTAATGIQIGPGLHAGTPHLPESKPKEHKKERCKGCGLWVGKMESCELCESSKVKQQADIAQRTYVRPWSGPSKQKMPHEHVMEKCGSCGLWKFRRGACEHCDQLETTKQAARGINRRSLASNLASGRSFSMAGMHALNRKSTAATGIQIGPGLHAGTPHLPESKPKEHKKERCKGCGLWVGKMESCELCESSKVKQQADAKLKTRPRLRPQSASGMELGSSLRNAVEVHAMRQMELQAARRHTPTWTEGSSGKGVMLHRYSLVP